MKWVRAALIACALVLVAQQTASLAQEIRERRVTFERGASSAKIAGSITGYETIDYVLGAKAGQTLQVSLETSNTTNYFNVLPPGSETALFVGSTSGDSWTGVLPVDGDYRVRVYLMRSAARRHETAKYKLSVGIRSGPAGKAPASDALVAGTPYHATGVVPCSVDGDPKGSAQCSFGVIRGAPGNAEVRIAPPGYDLRLHPDTVQTTLMFAGNAVTSAVPKDKVTAKKQGDVWAIGVNDFYFYSVPEAVVVGG